MVSIIIPFGFWGFEIFDSSGKLTTDFIANSGIGATLINIGLVGLMLSSYVLLVGGQLNGPVIGAILSAVGFSAFGCHLKQFSDTSRNIYCFFVWNFS